MSISLLFKSKRGAKINELQLDATISENHNYDNEVTQYPVEDGGTITDNIRKMPDMLILEGFVTNSPISSIQERIGEVVNKFGTILQGKNLSRTDSRNNVEFALDELLKFTGRKIDGEDTDALLLTVTTGLRTYKNMAVRKLTIPRNRTTGDAIRFTLDLIQIKKVATETIAITDPKPADTDKTQSTVDKGNQPPTEVPSVDQPPKSIWAKGFDAVFGGK